jgi:hypothetical protein
MNAYEQNPAEQHESEIKSLAHLARTKITENILRNPSYYKLNYKELPVELKTSIFSPLPKLLTESVDNMLRALQGSYFNGDRIATSHDIRSSKEKLGQKIMIMGTPISLMINYYLWPKLEEFVSPYFLVFGIMPVMVVSYLKCTLNFAPNVLDTLSPQRQLIAELSRLVNIIDEIVQVVKKIVGNDFNESIEDLLDAAAFLPETSEDLPEAIKHMCKDASGREVKFLILFAKELNILLTGDHNYSREQYREILLGFNNLSERFAPEFYKEVLGSAVCKIASELHNTSDELVEVIVEQPVVSTHAGCQFLPPPKPVVGLKKAEQLTGIEIDKTPLIAIHPKSS